MKIFDKEIISLHIEGLNELISYYKEYDLLSSEIRDRSNFHCLPGCGACCMTASSNIEVSLFEIIPMAIQIIQTNQEESFLQLLSDQEISSKPCVMYHKTSKSGNLGYCTSYGYRPMICRLFGGSSRIYKQGERRLVLCKLLKDNQYLSQEVLESVANEMPICSDISAFVRGLNSDLGNAFYPINIALKMAIELVLFRLHWLHPEKPEPDSPPFDTAPLGNFPSAA